MQALVFNGPGQKKLDDRPKPGTILGHEGVGIGDSVGTGVTSFKAGDRVLRW